MEIETSTPVRPKNRRSLFINTNTPFISSPLRRSNVNPVVLLEQVDDEQERSTRRSMVAMQRRLTNINSSNTSSPGVEINQITNEFQIQDHLKICTKLYTENKISTKNAWELHIIDIIRRITSTSTGNVLQVAGTSLDISTKVYSIRVDDVHTRGLKLASSMSTGNEGQSNQNGENDNGAGEDVQNRRKTVTKKKKKFSRDKKNIIDKEGKSLFAPIKEIETMIFSTKENIEVSAIENLFTNKLHVNSSSYQFMLLTDEKRHVTAPDVGIQNFEEEIDLDFSKPSHLSLHQPFQDFELGVWDPEEEDKQINNCTNLLPEAALDENGLPIAELDGSVHDIFADNNDDPISDIEEHHEEFQVQINGDIPRIVDAIPEENRIETEYGYNSLMRTSCGKFIDRIWAGPSHWKVKFNRRSSARYSGSVVQHHVARVKKLKVQQDIDLDNIRLIPLPTKKFVAKRKIKTLALEKITLPLPELSIEDVLRETNFFFNRTDAPRPKPFRQSNEAQDVEVQPYNYENLNDSQYCSQNTGDDNGHDDNDDIRNSFEEEAAAPAALQNFLGDNLVNAPEMVSSSQVPYAMQAKKMDMKKLKAAVWKRLMDNSGNQEGSINVKITSQMFSEVYKDLPNLLNKDMRKELSCPLVFVALLHLCNEQDLLLKRENPTDPDFCVIKAETDN